MAPQTLEHAEVADFRAEWVTALERLEVDVEVAEAMLATDQEVEPPAPWSPPVTRGPLPSDLEPRARLVLERQLAVAHRVAERLTRTGRHQRYTQAVRSTSHPDVPIYLDLRA
jgi:hypothetical protein